MANFENDYYVQSSILKKTIREEREDNEDDVGFEFSHQEQLALRSSFSDREIKTLESQLRVELSQFTKGKRHMSSEIVDDFRRFLFDQKKRILKDRLWAIREVLTRVDRRLLRYEEYSKIDLKQILKSQDMRTQRAMKTLEKHDTKKVALLQNIAKHAQTQARSYQKPLATLTKITTELTKFKIVVMDVRTKIESVVERLSQVATNFRGKVYDEIEGHLESILSEVKTLNEESLESVERGMEEVSPSLSTLRLRLGHLVRKKVSRAYREANEKVSNSQDEVKKVKNEKNILEMKIKVARELYREAKKRWEANMEEIKEKLEEEKRVEIEDLKDTIEVLRERIQYLEMMSKERQTFNDEVADDERRSRRNDNIRLSNLLVMKNKEIRELKMKLREGREGKNLVSSTKQKEENEEEESFKDVENEEMQDMYFLSTDEEEQKQERSSLRNSSKKKRGEGRSRRKEGNVDHYHVPSDSEEESEEIGRVDQKQKKKYNIDIPLRRQKKKKKQQQQEEEEEEEEPEEEEDVLTKEQEKKKLNVLMKEIEKDQNFSSWDQNSEESEDDNIIRRRKRRRRKNNNIKNDGSGFINNNNNNDKNDRPRPGSKKRKKRVVTPNSQRRAKLKEQTQSHQERMRSGRSAGSYSGRRHTKKNNPNRPFRPPGKSVSPPSEGRPGSSSAASTSRGAGSASSRRTGRRIGEGGGDQSTHEQKKSTGMTGRRKKLLEHIETEHQQNLQEIRTNSKRREEESDNNYNNIQPQPQTTTSSTTSNNNENKSFLPNIHSNSSILPTTKQTSDASDRDRERITNFQKNKLDSMKWENPLQKQQPQPQPEPQKQPQEPRKKRNQQQQQQQKRTRPTSSHALTMNKREKQFDRILYSNQKERSMKTRHEIMTDLKKQFFSSSSNSSDNDKKKTEKLLTYKEFSMISESLLKERDKLLFYVYITHKRLRILLRYVNKFLLRTSSSSTSSGGSGEFIQFWCKMNQEMERRISRLEKKPQKRKYVTKSELLRSQMNSALENVKMERKFRRNAYVLTQSLVGVMAKIYQKFKFLKYRSNFQSSSLKKKPHSRSYYGGVVVEENNNNDDDDENNNNNNNRYRKRAMTSDNQHYRRRRRRYQYHHPQYPIRRRGRNRNRNRRRSRSFSGLMKNIREDHQGGGGGGGLSIKRIVTDNNVNRKRESDEERRKHLEYIQIKKKKYQNLENNNNIIIN